MGVIKIKGKITHHQTLKVSQAVVKIKYKEAAVILDFSNCIVTLGSS